MSSAKEGACLDELIAIAVPICKEAERQCPRIGPGRKPDIPDWVMAVLIMVVTLKKKKSKNAQFRWIKGHRNSLLPHLEGHRIPGRSTYFDRFRRAHQLFLVAIEKMGNKAVRHGWADATMVAADKSLMHARGPKWWKSDREKNRLPLPGIDQESQWGYSSHHGWVQGYSFEVVVSCGKNGVIWPLIASVDTANVSEHKSFPGKIPRLPVQTRYVLVDSGYDNNLCAEHVEWKGNRRTGMKYLCPQNTRGGSGKLRPKEVNESKSVYKRSVLRAKRREYFKTANAQRRYRHRAQSVEPFNEWFKSAFELNTTVWHRGLDNNQTQVSASIFAYQVLLRHIGKNGNLSGQIKHPLLTPNS